MKAEIENGTRRQIKGVDSVHYDGYWIRYYEPPQDTLAAKKHLIDVLTKRLFHHTEAGINTPGEKLDEARAAYEREEEPTRKRVNGAMLAGALFNRATDIFTMVVELEQKGVLISRQNELMKQCGDYFQEALELGKHVHHYSGHEGIDELWGEPLKAFLLPVSDFYDSRYMKIAQAMRDIDRITKQLEQTLCKEPVYATLKPLFRELALEAKTVCETLRKDPVMFELWPHFVAAGEAVLAFAPEATAAKLPRARNDAGKRIIQEAKALIGYLASARVPMTKSAVKFAARCEDYLEQYGKPGRKRSGRAA